MSNIPRTRPSNCSYALIKCTPTAHYNIHILSKISWLRHLFRRTHHSTNIHTAYTTRTLDSYPVSTILGTTPPAATKQHEQYLLCEERIHQSRFRCENHTAVSSYMHRIGQASNAYCPHFKISGGSTKHLLLHCPVLKTNRDFHHVFTLEHLWERFETTMSYLRDGSII